MIDLIRLKDIFYIIMTALLIGTSFFSFKCYIIMKTSWKRRTEYVSEVVWHPMDELPEHDGKYLVQYGIKEVSKKYNRRWCWLREYKRAEGGWQSLDKSDIHYAWANITLPKEGFENGLTADEIKVLFEKESERWVSLKTVEQEGNQ